KEVSRDHLDTILDRQRIIAGLEAGLVEEDLRPGDLPGLYETLKRLPSAVETDADNFKAVLMVFVVDFLQIRHFSHAGTAPGCPKIDENDMAAPLLDVERGPIERGSCNLHLLASLDGARQGRRVGTAHHPAREGSEREGCHTADNRTSQTLRNSPP